MTSINNRLQGLPAHLHDPWYRFSRFFHECELAGLAARNQKVLDLGCAQGFLEKQLIERWCCQVEGWDKRDYRWADQRLDEWQFELCDISAGWPQRDHFNSIFAFEVFEHMIDTDLFLERCHAYLKPGGRLYLSTPNIACLHNRLRLLIGKYPHLIEYPNEIHHVRMYTVPVLLQHLSCHGFKPLICKGVNLLPITSHKIKVLDKLSASMASHLPSFCSQVFVVAEAIQ